MSIFQVFHFCFTCITFRFSLKSDTEFTPVWRKNISSAQEEKLLCVAVKATNYPFLSYQMSSSSSGLS